MNNTQDVSLSELARRRKAEQDSKLALLVAQTNKIKEREAKIAASNQR